TRRRRCCSMQASLRRCRRDAALAQELVDRARRQIVSGLVPVAGIPISDAMQNTAAGAAVLAEYRCQRQVNDPGVQGDLFDDAVRTLEVKGESVRLPELGLNLSIDLRRVRQRYENERPPTLPDRL